MNRDNQQARLNTEEKLLLMKKMSLIGIHQEDIAKELGCSPMTVRIYLSRHKVDFGELVGYSQHPSIPDYLVSRDGNVYTKKHQKLMRINSSKCRKTGKMEGYTNVCGESVHRLVADTFIPNPENKPFINHKNGIKYDNHVDNLEWVTNEENIRHARQSGLFKCKKGLETPTSKLNLEKAKEIRALREKGMSTIELASLYGTSRATISKVVNNKIWV
jgi:predicted transcriptional regulator